MHAQASTLTYFSTCPFGQLTKKSTCPTQSFSCPKKLVANQKQELPLAAIFVGGTERNGETL
jgi:hypothetical protein